VSSYSIHCVSSQLSVVDGGGIRGYYSLLILKLLMTMVKIVEQSFTDGNGVESPADSSFWPHNQPLHVSHTALSGESEGVSRNDYLPCHYFDTISGTSTGGYVQRPYPNFG
jgi:Patatin-like phospholipase